MLRHRMPYVVSRGRLVNQPMSNQRAGRLGTASVALLVYAWTSAVGGQQASLSYDLILSRDQVEGLRQAWNDGLSYIPGEVLVKFRDGVTTARQARAMTEVPGRIDSSSMRRVGDALLMKAIGEPNADRLASTLQSQPEVLWAQPNYFRRLKWVPNDPGYARQWNFDLINMPFAWDIDNGASDKVVVAVVDTGIATVTRSYDFKLWTGLGIETVAVPFRVNPDLGGSRILTGRDFAFWTGPVIDMVGHGTARCGDDRAGYEQPCRPGRDRPPRALDAAQGMSRVLGDPVCALRQGCARVRPSRRDRRMHRCRHRRSDSFCRGQRRPCHQSQPRG